MNINRVYECELWIVLDRNVDFAKKEVELKCTFLKKALVYIDNLRCYYDLSTKMYYPTDYKLCYSGQIYIKPDTLVPVSTLIDVKRDNMTKRKILKKYKEKNGGKNEKSI